MESDGLPAAAPAPLSGTLEAPAFEARFKVADRAPVAEGVKASEMLHEPEGATVVQLFVCENSAAFAPVIVAAEITRGADPGFVTVTV